MERWDFGISMRVGLWYGGILTCIQNSYIFNMYTDSLLTLTSRANWVFSTSALGF